MAEESVAKSVEQLVPAGEPEPLLEQAPQLETGNASSPAEAEQTPEAVEALETLTDSLSPEQLGEMLGRFIHDLDSAAQQAKAGAEQAAEQLGPEKAGKALGDFVRAFNRAVQGLDVDAQSSPAEGEAAEQ